MGYDSESDYDDGPGCDLSFMDLVIISVMFLGFGVGVAGFASPYWLHGETGEQGTSTYSETYAGLFETCVTSGTEEKDCTPFYDTDGGVPEFWLISLISASVSVIATLLGFCTAFWWLCSETRKKVAKGMIISWLLMSVVTTVTAAAVYGVKYEDRVLFKDLKLNWSFYLYLSSAPLIIVSALGFLFMSPLDQPVRRRLHHRRRHRPPMMMPPPPMMPPHGPPSGMGLEPGQMNALPLVIPAHAQVLPDHPIQKAPPMPQPSRPPPMVNQPPKKKEWSWSRGY